MEEDIKHHKHANFFRRMRKLTRSRVIPLNISVWLGINMVNLWYNTSRAEIGQLEFVSGPSVWTPIQGSSSVVMICIQGKHFCTREDYGGRKVNNGRGGKIQVIIECAIM